MVNLKSIMNLKYLLIVLIVVTIMSCNSIYEKDVTTESYISKSSEFPLYVQMITLTDSVTYLELKDKKKQILKVFNEYGIDTVKSRINRHQFDTDRIKVLYIFHSK